MNSDSLPIESNNLKHVITLICLIGFLSVTNYMLSVTPADTDIHGHVTYGERMIKSLSIPTKDPYSYTAKGARWINHEWLGEVTFALLHEKNYFRGLHLLRVGLFLGIIIVFWLFWFRETQIKVTHYYFVLTVTVTAFLLIPFFMIRPQIFSFLFFCLLLYVIYSTLFLSSSFVWVSIPIMVLWTNFHGGFVVGVGLMIFLLTISYYYEKDNLYKIILAVFTAILSTLVNPYGINLHVQIYESLTNPVTDILIEDWKPIWEINLIRNPSMVMVPLTAILILIAFLSGDRNNRIEVFFIISIACLISGVLTVRNLAFFALTQPFFWGIWLEKNRSFKPPNSGLETVVSFLLLTSIVLWTGLNGSFRENPVNQFPEKTVKYMKHQGIEGNLATPFKWGQYCIYHLYPSILVSMDGRYDTVYPNDVIYDFVVRIYGGGNGWKELLRRYKTDFLLVASGSELDRKAQSSDLLQIYSGGIANLYRIPSDNSIIPGKDKSSGK